MVVCTFFGHRDSPEHLQDALSAAIKQAILKYHVDTFYVGNHGCFDAMALHALKETQKMFPHISYSVVLAYFPTEQTNTLYEHTLYPEGLETVPKKIRYFFPQQVDGSAGRRNHRVYYAHTRWSRAICSFSAKEG